LNTAILDQYRNLSKSEREKGGYFEKLIQCYLLNEPSYKDLYSDVCPYADFARSQGLNAQDAGIDLVARTCTGEFHAVQCKLYASEYTLQKGDIDSFFTASGKKIFSHRIIVSTTNNWSHHAEEALSDQNPPVTKIDLAALEASRIDWIRYQPGRAVVLKPKKQLRPHQVSAVNAVTKGLASADRGKLLMACGTGKTFTALKIAEQMAGKNGRVLFLVPSLSLLSQTITEWTQESDVPLHSFAVCSDSDVGKKRSSLDDDYVPMLTHELQYPATTNAKNLAHAIAQRHDRDHMSVVYSTYHSIDVISQAQKRHGLGAFDLIVCDEAHRTTGAVIDDDKESNFVKVHNAKFLSGHKRLYMMCLHFTLCPVWSAQEHVPISTLTR
jgi:predicted helicase